MVLINNIFIKAFSILLYNMLLLGIIFICMGGELVFKLI